MATLATARPARDLSKDQGVTGLRAALNILDKWQASSEQACRILRISRSTYTRARQRDPAWTVGLDTDQLQRISMVLNIHAALRLLFDNPDNVYGFPAMANHNAFFNGRAPLEIMAQGDMISLYETYRRIDALRGAQW
ncbi:MAG TPA: antitoxin Xre-like helix-turn-helix domain-containing protein [Pseudomonas sp.]|uniref:antitoxin Xre-like helix-turn-helix domain-containing protein n=1 Tax=Pseudomonas sp. TaxID=306 RepID=UPI002CF9D5AC|nr:antitoxin Xre-like helix-turn-helix domain-containing protein [Pseudomonas sp.]HTO20533.1 antitoxin Xre-like helix-turn-helix domain-containing protein [Pseudomonas sp.]